MSDPVEPPNGQKVTVALLGQKMDALTQEFREFVKETKEHRAKQDTMINDIHECMAVEAYKVDQQGKKITELEDRIESVKKWDFSWNGINSAVAALATYLGVRQ